MAFIYDLADTWNDAGTTFTAIKMNVTDTASDAASLLMDLQVGGTSMFSVTKAGYLNVVPGGPSNRPIYFSDNDWGFWSPDTKLISVGNSGNNSSSAVVGFEAAGLVISKTKALGWSSSIKVDEAGTADLFLTRDAANTLAQRNGTDAQTFNLYKTYTNASNYERGFMKWNSDVLEIGTEGLGTGAATPRAVSLYGATVTIDGPGDGSYTLKRNGTQHISAGSAGPRFSLPPYPAGTVDLGLDEVPWRDIYLKPSSSLTPTSNGDLCIEATDNTTLTFKYKGSDGVVRSGTVALS